MALTAPSERGRSQRYLQRYVQHLPSAGEIVLFDRSPWTVVRTNDKKRGRLEERTIPTRTSP